MKMLVACEFTGIVREAFRKRGHDAWSCDLLPSEIEGPHIQDDVFNHLDEGWDMLIFFWPCTWSTRSGARWLFGKPLKPNPKILYLGERRAAMIQAANQFRRLLDYGSIPMRCGENPRPYKDALAIMGPWSQSIQPWMFGDGECKETCLWIRGLPLLQKTHGRDDLFLKREPVGRVARVHHMPKSEHRGQDRSRTLPSFANAMAKQWGSTKIIIGSPETGKSLTMI